MRRSDVKRALVPLAAIVVMIVVALAMSFYILRQERLPLPTDDIYTVRAELPTGQSLTPGQGQSVTVAGVKVGEIARVQLRDGRALVDLAIKRAKLPRGIGTDATMLVRPRTPLQDMTIDVDPGSARAPRLSKDRVLSVDRTTPSVNLDEVLAALDADTRDWATALVNGLGHGVENQGQALRALFKASAPTLAVQRRVARATAGRRHELRRAVGALRQLTAAVAAQDDSLGRLVEAGDVTFGTLAGEQRALRAGLARLPGTLQEAEGALAAARPFARAGAPALRALLPAARRLPATLRALDPLQREGLPALQELRAVARSARPAARSLRAAAGDLATVTPSLDTAFGDLRYFTNLFAYNPPGKEEGYLFWLAWFLHNGHSFLTGQDANGVFWRGSAIFSCSGPANGAPVTDLLSLVIGPLNICPTTPGAGSVRRRESGGRSEPGGGGSVRR